MERLNHSEGPMKVQAASGKTRYPGNQGAGDPSDLLFFIRQSHPYYFQQNPYQLLHIN